MNVHVTPNFEEDCTSKLVSEFREFSLAREDDAGMIFVSCDAIPELFIAIKNENDLRCAIDICLTNAFDGVKASVFTNGSIKGPTIKTVVKLTK